GAWGVAMLCLCKQQITTLGQRHGLFAGLPLLRLSIDLSQLSLRLGALSAAAQLGGVSAQVLASLPGLPAPALSAAISAPASARLTGLGMGLQAVQQGLGITLLLDASLPRLNALATSLSLHGPMLGGLLAALEAEIAGLLGLLPLASALQSAL